MTKAKQFWNQNEMEIKLDEEKDIKWRKAMPKRYINKIMKGIKVSTFHIPLPYPYKDGNYILDTYMQGPKALKKNSKGEQVYTRMYRYLVTKEIMEQYMQFDSLGQAYNFLVKQNEGVSKGIKMMDLTNPDDAPTRKDLGKKYKTKMKKYTGD